MTSPWWLLVEGIYIAVAVALLGAAFRSRGEWTRASLGALGVSILAWRTLAVIPSWWLYYADGELRWGGQGCTTLNFWAGDEVTRQAAQSCVKQSLKDVVVVVENAVVLGAFVVGFLKLQKRFPKQLAPGEGKPEATGGYR